MTKKKRTTNTAGGFICESRDAANLMQHELAELVGVARSVVCRWEKGVLAPTAERCVQISDLLGVNRAELLARAAFDKGTIVVPKGTDLETLRWVTYLLQGSED